MFFLTMLFGLLGLTVDFQPSPSPAAQGGGQTEQGGGILVGGSQGDAQPTQDIPGQGGTQPEQGGFIIVGG